MFDRISLEPDVRAVVLASALPRLFSAGLDRKYYVPIRESYPHTSVSIIVKGSDKSASYNKEPARRALQLRKDIQIFQSAISATERCPYPVIAAVHGVAYGLAIDIITTCDVRLAAEDSKLAIKVGFPCPVLNGFLYVTLIISFPQEVDIGLASDIGTLARLPKLAGNQSLVHEFSYTARPFSAVEAEKMGLVSRVVPGSRAEVVKEALAIAKTIAAKSPVAVHGTKRVLQYSRDHSVQDNLEFVAGWNAAMLQTAVRYSARITTYIPLI